MKSEFFRVAAGPRRNSKKPAAQTYKSGNRFYFFALFQFLNLLSYIYYLIFIILHLCSKLMNHFL